MGPLPVMRPLPVLLLLLGTVIAVNSERHSLTYIYTALSRPVTNPGIHEFTAMGLLDTKMIDYFDSDRQVKVPKQPWMKEKLGPDYWDKGTQSRKSKQQWFKVNLDILKERKNQSDHEIHVLQWMHGCEAKIEDDGKPQFVRGIDQYSYDGDSFLYFDDEVSVWVAAAVEAEPTKRKWDEVQVLKDYTKGYLEKECLDWLSKFMDYGKQQLKHAKAPEVYMYSTPSRQSSSFRLHCMATGFYPPDIVLTLLRDGVPLLDEDVTTTGIRPNQDDTYQLKNSIEVAREDKGRYSCEVRHPATGVHIKKEWDGILTPHPDEVGDVPMGGIIGGVVGGVVLLGLVGVIVGIVLYKKPQSQKNPPPQPGCDVALLSSVVANAGSSGSSQSSSSSGSAEELNKEQHKSSQDSAIGDSDSGSGQSAESVAVTMPLMNRV
ncbi:patr class I histocompatibility antigen, alpha chain G-like [Eucyclogobius newberryi]|uniref:patr class I histocompatibility antigen, alpha chain G-like n=1 Tax=Eucyclogobius newberryi TaxID=166745 RepID=UPI003B5B86E5